MKSATLMHVGGYLSVALIVLSVGLATPFAQAYAPMVDTSLKGGKSTVKVLADPTSAGAYKVSYFYADSDGKAKSDDQPSTVIEIGGSTAAVFNSTVRTVGIDLSKAVLTAVPDYGHLADSAVGVIIKFPEKANLLFDQTVAKICAGFALERGDRSTTAARDLSHTYTMTVGSGSAILMTKSFTGDADTGDADSKDAGDCPSMDHAAATHLEYGSNIGLQTIEPFLTDAYVAADPASPTPLFIKITGVRAKIANVTAGEAGDVFDAGFQAYTYTNSPMSYASGLAWAQFMVAVLGGVLVGVMLGFVRVPGEHVQPNIRRVRGPPGGA